MSRIASKMMAMLLCLSCNILRGETHCLSAQTRFKASHNCTPVGPVMCATETAAVMDSVRSQIDCSQRCSLDDSCVSFNFKKKSDRQSTNVCERFSNYIPFRFTVEENCAHYQVQSCVGRLYYYYYHYYDSSYTIHKQLFHIELLDDTNYVILRLSVLNSY